MSFYKLMLCVFSFLATSITFAINVAYEDAKNAGIKKCLPTIKSITNHLVQNEAHGAYNRWSKHNPDKQQFVTAIERNFHDGTVLANVVVSPVISGDCAVEYDQVFFMEKSCMAVRSEIFPNMAYKKELNKEVTVLNDTDLTAVAFLMQVKSGCVIVKNEHYNVKTTSLKK